jgi:hypothetical protein
MKSHNAATELAPVDDLGGELAARELDLCARQQLLAGPHERFPHQRLKPVDQEDFGATAQHDFTAHGLPQPPADQPRRKDARVVQNQHVAGAQELWQVVEHRVRERTRRAVNDQQPRLIAPRRRLLRDQSFGQLVIEFGNKHE